MINSLKKYSLFQSSIFGLEYTDQDELPVINGIEVKIKKGEFDIVQSFQENDIQAILKYFKKSDPVVLIISDSNVLSKQVTTTGSDHEVLSAAYPNLDLQDFYFEILKTETRSFVSVCRKEYVDQRIDSMVKENINITSFSLGNLQSGSLIPYINQQEYQTYTSKITTNGPEIETIIQHNEPSSKTYHIGDLKIESTYLLSLAGIINEIGGEKKTVGNLEETLILLKKKFKEKQFFKKTLTYGIGIILGALLINFLIFSRVYKEWQQLQEEVQIYTTQKQSIVDKQTVVTNKEAIVNSILNTGFSKSSLYVDQIIQLVPQTLILESFTYQPISKTIRKGKSIILKNNLITITGKSTDKEAFTNWINRLENLDFINQIIIGDYGFEKKATSNFEILLKLNQNDTKK